MSQVRAFHPWRAELGATLLLAAPLVLANLLQMAVYAIDVIFVARLGETALAAASLATSLFGLLVWSLSGLTGAVAPLVAAELGRGRHAVREVRRSVRMALWLTVLAGLMAMVLCSFGEEILLATGQQPEIAALGGRFLGLLLWSLIPQIFCNVLRIFVAALGRPIFATAITAMAIVTNAIGNYAFVFGNFGMPRMGLEGSAVSTIVTSLLCLAAYVGAIQATRRLRRYYLFGNLWRPEWTRLKELVRIGLPIALIVAAEGGLFGSAAFLMGLIGEAQLAGHTIALQLAAFAFQVPFGVAQAATIRVGLHFGAGDREGIARAGWTALGLAVAFCALPAGMMVFAPQLLISAYVDVAAPQNASMIGFARQFLLVAAAFQLFDGTQSVAAGALRGLQDTRVPLLIALFGYWAVGFSTATLLGFGTGLAGIGVWIGLAVGLVAVASLLVARWRARERLRLVDS